MMPIGIQEGDKIGIVGINGTGKSTLLRMIAGDEVPDSGNIIRQNQLKLAWLPQEPKFPEGATILSYAGDDETGMEDPPEQLKSAGNYGLQYAY